MTEKDTEETDKFAWKPGDIMIYSSLAQLKAARAAEAAEQQGGNEPH